jgi:EF-P beta-lysylation protein EpmB
MHDNQPIRLIKKNFPLSESAQEAARLFSFLVTDSFSSRIDWNNHSDPLLLQVLPSPKELDHGPGFLRDPLREKEFTLAPGIIKKYPGRIIFQLTGACPIHCRYCFRRHNKNKTTPTNQSEWKKAIESIQKDPSIKEVIYSGGDPLMLPIERVLELSQRLADIPHIQRIRIHTRLPVADPKRVTSELIKGLKKLPLVVTMVIHMNHPQEMSSEVETLLGKIVDEGIPLYNQSVLLKGINDDIEILTKLSESLIQARVTPYYLHLLDPVEGATHFQVSEGIGVRLIGEMRNRLPGFAIPTLVRELPGKHSKTVIY